MTCEPSPRTNLLPMELPQTASSAASRVKTLAPRDLVPALKASAADFGLSMADLLASFDPATSSWRTSQLCLVEGWTVFSGTWPRSGMMRGGIAYPLSPLAPLTGATASGLWATPVAQPANGTPERFLERKRESVARGHKMGIALSDLNMQVQAVEAGWFPTPRATDGNKGSRTAEGALKELRRGKNIDLCTVAKLWPTPTANEDAAGRPGSKMQKMLGNHPDIRNSGDGTLNPRWVEWLMGFPDGWTDLSSSETP